MRARVAIRPPTLPISGSHLPSWQDATTSSPTFWRHCGPGRVIRSLCRHCSGTGASARPACWTRSGTGSQAARVVGGKPAGGPGKRPGRGSRHQLCQGHSVMARSWARLPPGRRGAGRRLYEWRSIFRGHSCVFILGNQGEGTLIGRVGRSDGWVRTRGVAAFL